ncbi:hypothetical protein Z517_11359 [Fonsecaea pedrosoi CBS 271.37]|uniref:Uncharacterized protein n=1 Tax=Fonsecaea pedrosoi CBS 271.37 TaxID=1442368 RepID=A0A0D2GQB7_9EURO|nr:uncharacterized protein Z517_11359 [Fonsecaea pedrosoi CBS 271.37]KIW74589.1 hypothetical protein Z517_11359 [Fonsecaea pedrosoi CBS 271.37]
MRALDLQDDKGKIGQAEYNVKFEGNVAATGDLEAMSDANRIRETDAPVTADGSGRPLSSSQLPKPRESLLRSLSRHVDSPAPRQTKTSALRLHQAKTIAVSVAKKPESSTHIPSDSEGTGSASFSRSKQSFPGGPIRTNSRGRYGVTGRGSPYTIPSRSKSIQKLATRAGTCTERRTFRSPATSQGLDLAQYGATHQQPSAREMNRKSSLPLPTRLTRPSLDESIEGILRQTVPSEPFMNSMVGKHPVADDVPSHPVKAFAINGVNQNNDLSRATPKDKGKLMDVREVLSTTAPRDDESFVDSDGESGVSIHGYDSFGGYRVRRILNGSRMGPTLRITDSASRVLLGQDDKNTLRKRSPKSALKHKGSAPHIGSPRMAKDQIRRSSAIFGRSMSVVRNLADRPSNQLKHADQDETRNLIGEDSSVDTVVRAELPNNNIDTEHGLLLGSHMDLSGTEGNKEAVVSQTTPTSIQSDWPCKDFASFEPCSDHDAIAAKQKENTSSSAADELITKRPTPSSLSRPPTIVLRTAPNKETAPFLFQDLGQEQAKQEKLVNDLAKATHDEAAIISGPQSTTPFPPRTSSRKPKPPPIIVSPPERHLPAISFLPQRAPKAYAVSQDNIKKPRNVKTFSQSISPRTDSVKGRKISHVLAHSPSSSSKKKVISNIRGLFHKRSVESNKATTAVVETTTVSEEMNSQPGRPAGAPGSLRRKTVPASTSADADDKRASPPLQVNASGSGQPGQVSPKLTQPGLPNSDYPRFPCGNQATEPRLELGRTDSRAPKRKNPLISPTTPFTANLNTSMYPSSPLPSSAVAANATINKMVSPTLHAHPQARSPATLSPTIPQTLAATTSMTHSLLDLARTSADPNRKARLIQLSKCMVEVVGSARDAEKAMEKARMEASRAECAWLKCLKEIGQVEGLVRGLIEPETMRK